MKRLPRKDKNQQDGRIHTSIEIFFSEMQRRLLSAWPRKRPLLPAHLGGILPTDPRDSPRHPSKKRQTERGARRERYDLTDRRVSLQPTLRHVGKGSAAQSGLSGWHHEGSEKEGAEARKSLKSRTRRGRKKIEGFVGQPKSCGCYGRTGHNNREESKQKEANPERDGV